jgi:shikimate dehydrogenase
MKIDSHTALYGVIGDPVSHSLSPAMHNAAFAHIGYNGAYLAFQVKEIKAAISGVRGLGIKGLSVTIPHKLSVMECLDHIDETASKIGAVNTVVNQDDKLSGFNTDCLGALHALLEKTPVKDKKILLVGAGGAARAIGFGILAEGGKPVVVNILEDEGKTLAKDLGVDYYHLSEFNQLEGEIVINATPVGMTPNIDAMPVDKADLNSDMVVMDIVYNPLKTRLLKEAEALGCRTVDGVSMFVYQGVAQFEMWTGEKAPVDLMREIVLDALNK